MNWLKTKVRDWLGITDLKETLSLVVGCVEEDVHETQARIAALANKIDFLQSFFGSAPDDGEPVTKADLSDRSPWDAT